MLCLVLLRLKRYDFISVGVSAHLRVLSDICLSLLNMKMVFLEYIILGMSEFHVKPYFFRYLQIKLI